MSEKLGDSYMSATKMDRPRPGEVYEETKQQLDDLRANRYRVPYWTTREVVIAELEKTLAELEPIRHEILWSDERQT